MMGGWGPNLTTMSLQRLIIFSSSLEKVTPDNFSSSALIFTSFAPLGLVARFGQSTLFVFLVVQFEVGLGRRKCIQDSLEPLLFMPLNDFSRASYPNHPIKPPPPARARLLGARLVLSWPFALFSASFVEPSLLALGVRGCAMTAVRMVGKVNSRVSCMTSCMNFALVVQERIECR